MIPNFTDDGTLPSGIHEASLDEVINRFGYNEHRAFLCLNLERLLNDLRGIGCSSIYLDGSFVTDKVFPKDLDVCWDNKGLNLLNVKNVMPILFDFDNNRQNQQRKYHADIFPAFIIEGNSGIYFLDFFQFDRDGNQKGILKIQIV